MWVIQDLDLLSKHYLILYQNIHGLTFGNVYSPMLLYLYGLQQTVLNVIYIIFGHRKGLQYFMIFLFFLQSLNGFLKIFELRKKLVVTSRDHHGGEEEVWPGLSFLPPAVVDNRLVEKEWEASSSQGEEEEEGLVWSVDQIKDGATCGVRQQGLDLVLGVERWRKGVDHTESYGRNSSVDVENTLRSK